MLLNFIQTIMFIKRFTKHLTYKYYCDEQDNSIIKASLINCPKFFPFYLKNTERKTFPYPYKELFSDDYARRYVCVRYLLAYLFWLCIFKAGETNHRIQSFVYYTLKNKFNQGNDFIPTDKLVGNWFNMLGHFIRKGRGQEAEGRREFWLLSSARDHREQGFKTHTELRFSGSKSGGV